MKDLITGAEALMRSLEHQGVTTIFGYPGGSIMPVFDALYDHQNILNHILVRHEQGAAHAAQGYARVSGDVGVCLVTSGPGATNTVTGIADAMIDSTPIVVIAGQVGTGFLGTDAFQEVDIVGMTRSITKYGVTVISDEIHCDLTDPGKEYVPFATASDTCRDISVTCIAPTKTFNIAGIQTAAIVVPDKFLRHKMWRGLNTDEVAEPNAFAVDAAIAAFTNGGEWLDSLRQYLYENKQYVRKFVSENIPDMKVVYSEATYLLWLDCSKITDNAKQLSAFIRKNTGLYMSPGLSYGKNGKAFIRLNIACPRSIVEEGMKRLAEGTTAFRKMNAETVNIDNAAKKGDIDE